MGNEDMSLGVFSEVWKKLVRDGSLPILVHLPPPPPPVVGHSDNDAGVYGSSNDYGADLTNNNFGQVGVSGRGVFGVRGNGSIGVHGVSNHPWYGAVQGEHLGNGYGLVGDTSGDKTCAAVLARSNGEACGVESSSKNGVGVWGKTESPDHPGVLGENTAAGPGVKGTSTGLTAPGVLGDNTSAGPGVAGTSALGTGVTGKSVSGSGLVGESESGTGVTGKSDAGTGIVGVSKSGTGVSGTSHVRGTSGVHGVCDVVDGYGVSGQSDNGAAIFGFSLNNLAAHFVGKVQIDGEMTVTGQLNKSGGGFKINHPLDPTRRYLNHSFVESPERMNIYNGNVVLDKHGRAVVTLPGWFEVLNQNFSYQLTPIGYPMPNLHIAAEVRENIFTIAGGTPGSRVSWQVTGVRHDVWAVNHPLPVEQDKTPEECEISERSSLVTATNGNGHHS